MPAEQRDHDLPSDRPPASGAEGTTTTGLLAHVGEDVARGLATYAALFVAALCLLAGLLSDADPAVRAAGTVVGAVGFLAVSVATLAGWRRSRLWGLVLVSLSSSAALFAVMVLQDGATT